MAPAFTAPVTEASSSTLVSAMTSTSGSSLRMASVAEIPASVKSEVEKVQQASQQTLEQSKETIKNLLRSQRQQKALDEFIKDFREDYKDETACADDFRVAECNNAPKEKTDTGPASGGAAGGAQPQPEQGPTPENPQP